MAEILNLRQARKRRRREDEAAAADTNRVLHGTPKHLRSIAAREREHTLSKLEGHRLEPDGPLGAHNPSDEPER